MNAQDERTEVEAAIAAWESSGPTSLTVALMADALYGVRERDHEARHVSPDDCMLAGCTIPRGEVTL